MYKVLHLVIGTFDQGWWVGEMKEMFFTIKQ
jgi:hypothetical protein